MLRYLERRLARAADFLLFNTKLSLHMIHNPVRGCQKYHYHKLPYQLGDPQVDPPAEGAGVNYYRYLKLPLDGSQVDRPAEEEGMKYCHHKLPQGDLQVDQPAEEAGMKYCYHKLPLGDLKVDRAADEAAEKFQYYELPYQLGNTQVDQVAKDAGEKYPYYEMPYHLGYSKVDQLTEEGEISYYEDQFPCQLGYPTEQLFDPQVDQPFFNHPLAKKVSTSLALQREPWLKKFLRKLGLTYYVDPFDEAGNEYIPQILRLPMETHEEDILTSPPEPWFQSLVRRVAYTYFIDLFDEKADENGLHKLPSPLEYFPQPKHRKLVREVASIFFNDSEEDEVDLIRARISMRRLIDQVQACKKYGHNKSPFQMDDPPDQIPWLEEVVQKVAPAIVNISIIEQVHGEFVTKNNGSGVIVSAKGNIMTAFDLVANGCWWPFQWTPKGQIMVTLQDGRRFVANLVVADKDLGIAVLKIMSEDQLIAAVAGKLNIIDEDGPIINLEWPPKKSNSIVGWPRYETGDLIHLVHDGYTHVDPTNKESFGGPIINCDGHVLGITQKKSPKYNYSLFATKIENAMKMLN